MRYASRHELLTMAQAIIQQPEFKIPQSYLVDKHLLTTVARIILMSFVIIQLIDLRSQGTVPNNLNESEKKISESLLKKSKYLHGAQHLRNFLQKIRAQLVQVTQAFHEERVPRDYPAKNKLIELYDYLLRDSLMLHPTCPFFPSKESIPLQPFESLLGFYWIEIEIKQLVEVNDALSPYFRTLLGIWQKPDALKSPMTVAGLAAQHIDWGGSLSWMGLGLPALSFITPPSIKSFVYKSEYQGVVFSAELRDFLVPETKLGAEVAQVKRIAVQLLKTHEKLHTSLLKEHGLTRSVQAEEKEHRPSSETEGEEKDLTLTFAKSSIQQIEVHRKTDLTAAITAMDSALNHYLQKATGRVSLATLARRIKGWYERTPEIVYSLEYLLSLSDQNLSEVMPSTSGSGSTVESASYASTGSTTSSTMESVVPRPLSQSLSHTLVSGEAKKGPSPTSAQTPVRETSDPMVLKTK